MLGEGGRVGCLGVGEEVGGDDDNEIRMMIPMQEKPRKCGRGLLNRSWSLRTTAPLSYGQLQGPKNYRTLETTYFVMDAENSGTQPVMSASRAHIDHCFCARLCKDASSFLRSDTWSSSLSFSARLRS